MAGADERATGGLSTPIAISARNGQSLLVFTGHYFYGGGANNVRLNTIAEYTKRVVGNF